MPGFLKRHGSVIVVGTVVYLITGLIVWVSFAGLDFMCSEPTTRDKCVASLTTPIGVWLSASPILAGLIINADELRRNRLQSERELGEAMPTITVLQNAAAANAHIANIIITNWNSRPIVLRGYSIDGPGLAESERIKFRFEKELERHDGFGRKTGRFSTRPSLEGRTFNEGTPPIVYFQLRVGDGKSVAGASVTITCDIIGYEKPLLLAARVHPTHWSPTEKAMISDEAW
ncbi:hypothetical protein [Rhizobium indigoferae]|uniref:Uncharacterized protein n=1 Tax=Rhizobium indigoferae TaxID=158891 RepID=A0ABZ0ZDL8_9HYPH|nr:hypothetical protein [Rhizobium indigoferae]NNU56148.1 hypothetical protein [Rhizobium indigoferae]WQN37732.1 hypothetical protein U5G49_002870 [Rhizobium indigoferae]GLR59324.1 hypothetical protein GCM10007919_40510 [Rhizobium indigoferae]